MKTLRENTNVKLFQTENNSKNKQKKEQDQKNSKINFRRK